MLVHEPHRSRWPGCVALALDASASLIIVAAIIPGLTVHRLYTCALATIIIWITTALAAMIGRRIVRERGPERREAETVR